MIDTYVVTKTVTDEEQVSTVTFLFMLANNGTYYTEDIEEAIVFHNAAVATKQAEIMTAIEDGDAVYAAKKVTLEDLANN